MADVEPTFANLGFEIAGTGPGDADNWTVSSSCQAEDIASYVVIIDGTPFYYPWEAFEGGWSDNQGFVFSFDAGSLEAAEYDEVTP